MVDGREGVEARVDLALPGCQTTARVRDGVADFVERHIARLHRDCARVGLTAPDADRVVEVFRTLGRAAFAAGEGVIRLELRPRPAGDTVSIAIPRPLGDDAPIWRATLAPFNHPGPGQHPGVKLTDHAIWARARAHALDRALDEALLGDEGGQLVEGARSATLVVRSDGSLAFPDPDLGGVASIGLAVLSDHAQGLEARRIAVGSLRGAREVIAVNSVRGVRPIVSIDGFAVGDGRPGPVARRLAAVFDAAVQEESRSSR